MVLKSDGPRLAGATGAVDDTRALSLRIPDLTGDVNILRGQTDLSHSSSLPVRKTAHITTICDHLAARLRRIVFVCQPDLSPRDNPKRLSQLFESLAKRMSPVWGTRGSW